MALFLFLELKSADLAALMAVDSSWQRLYQGALLF
jgi:hypothetical protein